MIQPARHRPRLRKNIQPHAIESPQPKVTNRIGIATALVVGLTVAYHLNGDVLPTTDAIGSMQVAVSVLNEGNWTFTAVESPFMFRWRLTTGQGEQTVAVKSWDDRIGSIPARRWYEAGALRPDGAKYYLVASRRVDRKSGLPLYVNTSGPGPGLVALPIFAAGQLLVGDFRASPEALWRAGRFVASVYVAGSAALLYLLACRWLAPRAALVLAVCYGLGTCVWSISSQALWQHGPNEFFLMLGVYFWCGVTREQRKPLLAGLAFSIAAVSRPTSGMMLLAVGAWLIWSDRRAALKYAIGAAPILAGLAIYNWYYFGSPFSFGQTLVGHDLAQLKCGQPGSWQTPLWIGMAGQLVSPSRGLFIFSPFLVFALWGMWRTWRDEEFCALRPIVVGLVLMLMVESKHYDWWGGWTFGYRHVVDLAPLLSLLVVPVFPAIVQRKWLTAIFAGTAAWSIGVQALGSYCYNGEGWNAPLVGYRIRMPGQPDVEVVASYDAAVRKIRAGGIPRGELREDIDDPQYRYRLWSITDNEIWYYASHLRECRAQRVKQAASAKHSSG